MRIYIDADACPVTRIAERVAKERGVLVVLEAEHTCMCMRGIRAAGSLTVTSAVRGFLKSDIKAREEALNLIGV